MKFEQQGLIGHQVQLHYGTNLNINKKGNHSTRLVLEVIYNLRFHSLLFLLFF